MLSCPNFVRINPSFVEYVVFLFPHLFDNCCNLFSTEREDRVSKFSTIRGDSKVTITFGPSAYFPPRKRSGTKAITNGSQLQNNCPLFVLRNQGNFMQSVIKIEIVTYGYCYSSENVTALIVFLYRLVYITSRSGPQWLISQLLKVLVRKKTTYLAQILQSLSYKVCFITLTKFSTMGLFILILVASTIMDQTACCYNVTTSETGL